MRSTALLHEASQVWDGGVEEVAHACPCLSHAHSPSVRTAWPGPCFSGPLELHLVAMKIIAVIWFDSMPGVWLSPERFLPLISRTFQKLSAFLYPHCHYPSLNPHHLHCSPCFCLLCSPAGFPMQPLLPFGSKSIFVVRAVCALYDI